MNSPDRDDVQRIFSTENRDKLTACTRHDFREVLPRRVLGSRFVCERCGGEAFEREVTWYRLGQRHGQEP